MAKKEKYLVSPDINNKSLITKLNGFDEKGNKIISKVINEKALTIFLNNQEIVTLMSISDHPKYLAVGYLLNQNMLRKNGIITKVEIDKDLSVVVVRTKRKTNYENKLRKKITTSGCAIGTVFGDIYAEIKKSKLKYNKEYKEKLNKLETGLVSMEQFIDNLENSKNHLITTGLYGLQDFKIDAEEFLNAFLNMLASNRHSTYELEKEVFSEDDSSALIFTFGENKFPFF